MKKNSALAEETLTETLARGIKQGGLKKSADKTIAKYTAPAAEKLKSMLHKISPDTKIADKGVDALTSATAMLGLAELLQASSGLTENIPGLKNVASPEKMQAIARWMRAHSGETMGQKSSDALYAIVPHVASALQSPELKAILSDEEVDEDGVPSRLSINEE
jgi:hypothetical protein